MSEENSIAVENGSEPLGRSSTIHLDMVDSPGTEANPAAAAAEVSGDLVHAIIPEEDELNLPINEAPVNGPTEESPGGDANPWAHLAKKLAEIPEKYEFSAEFPYYNKPGDIMYEQSRKRLLQSDGPGTDLWLHDTDIHMLLHPIIEGLRGKNAYVFSINAWNALRQEDLKGADQSRGIMIEHKAGTAYRYEEIVRKLIWLPNRGKGTHANRRQKQQDILNLFEKDVLFLPVNQDHHWSLIVVNKPKLIVQKLLDGDFTREEQVPPGYNEQQSSEGQEVADAVLPDMTSLDTEETEDGELEESEDENEQVETNEIVSQKSNNQDGMLESSSDEEAPESPREGETNESGANGSPEMNGDALDEDRPASDEANAVELSGLSLNEVAEAIANAQDEDEVNGERELPYDRNPEMSDEEEEDESSYDEEDMSEEESEEAEKFKRLHDEIEQRDKDFLCPSEDEPGIYLLCSQYGPDWYEKIEVANEFLTSAFLDRDNESLRESQDKLIEEGILELDEEAVDNRRRLKIVNGGRNPSTYFCNKLKMERSGTRLPWPCNRCVNLDPCLHKQLLPFKYGLPRGPHQANDFDCGPFTLFYIRRFFDENRPFLDSHPTALKKWFTLRDLFAFKYECRRFLDKLVGVPDREPVNQQGLADRYGYIDDFTAALEFWTEEGRAARQQALNPQATNAPVDSQDTPAENAAKDSADDGKQGESIGENGVHQDAPADQGEIVNNEEEGEILEKKDEEKREENAMEVDTNDTPPEVSPNYSEAQDLPVSNVVAEKPADKMDTVGEQQDTFNLEPASADLPTRRSSRRLSSTPNYVFKERRKPRPTTPGTPRRGPAFDTSSVESSPLVGIDVQRSLRSPVKTKGSTEDSVEQDRQAALDLYHTINQRASRTAKSKAVSVIPEKLGNTPSRGGRRSRASNLSTPAPAERTVKRKIEKVSKDDSEKNKRRKTTNDVPEAPKASRRTPARKKVNRRKTMSSSVEPTPEPWTGETFGWTMIRDIRSTFFKDNVYGNYNFHPENIKPQVEPPAQITPRRTTRRSVR